MVPRLGFIYAGEWGRRSAASRRPSSERSGTTWRSGVGASDGVAWLHFQALDFAGARSLCITSLTCARKQGLILTQQRGLAQARAGGTRPRARLGGARGIPASPRVAARACLLMDWFWCVPVDWA